MIDLKYNKNKKILLVCFDAGGADVISFGCIYLNIKTLIVF